MGIRIIAKTTSQKLHPVPINDGIHRTVVQPTIWYQCPIGKKALVKGTVRCSGTGAAATVDLDIAGVTDIRWRASTGWDIRARYNTDLRTDVPDLDRVRMTFVADLLGGQFIETNQSSGNNAEINMFAEVVESDV